MKIRRMAAALLIGVIQFADWLFRAAIWQLESIKSKLETWLSNEGAQ